MHRKNCTFWYKYTNSHFGIFQFDILDLIFLFVCRRASINDLQTSKLEKYICHLFESHEGKPENYDVTANSNFPFGRRKDELACALLVRMYLTDLYGWYAKLLVTREM